MNLKKLMSNRNNAIVFKNTFFAFLLKGIALFVSLFTTPAYINYFDNDVVLGVWYTMLSILMWFLNFDLGIGNGIRNRLVKDLANNDRIAARKTISSGLYIIAIVTLVLGLIGVLIVFSLDLNWLYNIKESVVSGGTLLLSTILVLIAIMFRFFLTTVSSIIYALQKSALNDLMLLSVSALQLVFVTLARFDTVDQKLIGLSLAYLVLSNLPTLIAGVLIFITSLKDCKPSVKHISKADCQSILNVGSIFFLCQILYMLIISSNEFLITLNYGPQYTTEYSFYYKLTSLISMIITMALTPVWSVVTKAMAENDYSWLSKLYVVLKRVGILAIVIQFLFIPFQQIVMDLWLRGNTIEVETIKAIAFASFGSVFIYSTILSTIVCGMAKMKIQAVCYLIGVILKFIVVFSPLNKLFDWELVIWCNVGVLLPYCVVQQISLNRFFKLKNKTEQNKEMEL